MKTLRGEYSRCQVCYILTELFPLDNLVSSIVSLQVAAKFNIYIFWPGSFLTHKLSHLCLHFMATSVSVGSLLSVYIHVSNVFKRLKISNDVSNSK